MPYNLPFNLNRNNHHGSDMPPHPPNTVPSTIRLRLMFTCRHPDYLDATFSQLASFQSYVASSPYPDGYDSTYHYALALASYNFRATNIISFDASINNKFPTYYEYTFQPMASTKLALLKMYLLVAKPSSSWVNIRASCKFWLNSVYTTTDISQFTTGNTFMKFNLTSSLDLSITSNIITVPFLICFDSSSQN